MTQGKNKKAKINLKEGENTGWASYQKLEINMMSRDQAASRGMAGPASYKKKDISKPAQRKPLKPVENRPELV